MNVVLSLSRRCAELRDQLARVLEEHSRQARAWSNERRWLKQRIAELSRRADSCPNCNQPFDTGTPCADHWRAT